MVGRPTACILPHSTYQEKMFVLLLLLAVLLLASILLVVESMHSVQDARVKKTRRFFEDRDGFISQLYKEIKSSVKSAAKKQIDSCFRLNLTSDYTLGAFCC